MKQSNKTIISLVLCLCLLTSMGAGGVVAIAAETQDESSSFVESVTEASSTHDDALEEPTEEQDVLQDEVDISKKDLPADEVSSSSSVLVEQEPANSESADQPINEPTKASLEEMLLLAATDGASTAENLNQYNGDEFYAYLREILKYYYGDNLGDAEKERVIFLAELDSRGDEVAQNFADAAAERAQAKGLGYVTGEVLVVFKDGVGKETAVDAVENADGMLAKSALAATPLEETAAVTEISLEHTVAQAIEEYEKEPEIEYAQPIFIYERAEENTVIDNAEMLAAGTVNDPYYGDKQWQHAAVNSAGAWDFVQQFGNKSKVKVAVIDSAVQMDHPDLAANINKSLARDFQSGVEAPLNNVTPDRHGTHVAGILGATANNNVGGVGVGSGYGNNLVDIIPINVFQGGNGNGATSLAVSTAIDYAVGRGVKVVNLSLGYHPFGTLTDRLLSDAIDRAVSKGVVVVCAAGNSNSTQFFYPADLGNTISVINVKKWNSVTENSRFQGTTGSNYGETKDVAAPGTNVTSTTIGSGYVSMTGTSMAAPVVSSIVAMMFYVNPNLTEGQVRSILRSTTTDLYTPGFDIETAYGCVNALEAVKKATGGEIPLDMPTGLSIKPAVEAVELRWKAVPGVSGYRVYRSTNANSGYTVVKQLTGTQFRDAELKGNTTYYYKIEAYKTVNGKTTYSDLTKAVSARTQAATTPLEQFIMRLYRLALNRNFVTASEVKYWSDKVTAGGSSGAELAYGFFFSDEYLKKKTSDEQYLDTLYKTILNRNVQNDKNGKAYWLEMMQNGLSRNFILRGVVESNEYTQICRNAGIKRGSITLKEPRDQNADITAFVTRLYKEALGRTPDIMGLNDWTGQLLAGRSAREVAYGFVFSGEMKRKNLSNLEYVKMMYRVFLGRSLDETGKKTWVGGLDNNTLTWENVYDGVAYSNEFRQIAARHGIVL